jgi:hypothetical protein
MLTWQSLPRHAPEEGKIYGKKRRLSSRLNTTSSKPQKVRVVEHVADEFCPIPLQEDTLVVLSKVATLQQRETVETIMRAILSEPSARPLAGGMYTPLQLQKWRVWSSLQEVSASTFSSKTGR